MSEPIKITDNRRPIVEPGGFVWPWSRGGRDLDIGQSALGAGAVFPEATVEAGPEQRRRRPRPRRSPAYGATPASSGLFGALARLIIGFFALLHAAPHLTGLFGLADLFYALVERAPQGEMIAAASRAWAFQATLVWVFALILRVVALNAARKEARGALALAAGAALIDLCVWFALGRQTGGDQAALLYLLAAEFLLTLGLVMTSGFLSGRRRRTEV